MLDGFSEVQKLGSSVFPSLALFLLSVPLAQFFCFYFDFHKLRNRTIVTASSPFVTMETTSRFGTSIPVSCSSTRRYQSLELPSPSHLAMLLLFSVLICSSGNHGVHATTEPTPAHHSSSSSSSSSHQDNNQHHHHPNNDDILRHHQGNHPTTVNNDNEHHKKLYNQHHQHHNHHATNSRVLELSDRSAGVLILIFLY